jgi:DNA-binding GntR family transcriptional regulator
MRERSVREKSDRIRSHETHLKILHAVESGREKDAVANMIAHLLEIEGGEAELE